MDTVKDTIKEKHSSSEAQLIDSSECEPETTIPCLTNHITTYTLLQITGIKSLNSELCTKRLTNIASVNKYLPIRLRCIEFSYCN